jgi:hypothetical protein
MENSETYVIEITRGTRKFFLYENLEDLTWMKTCAAKFNSFEEAEQKRKELPNTKQTNKVIEYSEARNH